jgi:hypothetical protein
VITLHWSIPVAQALAIVALLIWALFYRRAIRRVVADLRDDLEITSQILGSEPPAPSASESWWPYPERQ